MRHIPPPPLYRSLYERLIELMPNEVDSRLTNLVYVMMGIFLSKSVQTGRMASKVPIASKRLSIVRRLERFLANPSVRVREWYAPVARHWLLAAASSGQVRLIIDGTKVSFHHQLLMVAVCYKGRALPIAWTWLGHSRGHSGQYQQLALLEYVRQLVPAKANVCLVGDTEFGHCLVLENSDHWHWAYVLRQSGHQLVWTQDKAGWQALGEILKVPGEWRWLPNTVLTQASAYPSHLLLYWRQGEKRPWLLATKLTDPILIMRTYTRRMWIEELFGDLKKHGFDLESSHMQSFLHLSRLTLAVALLYVWLVTEGAQALIQGRSTQVDRSNRRDLSLFRIGLELVEQALCWGDTFRVEFRPILTHHCSLFFALIYCRVARACYEL